MSLTAWLYLLLIIIAVGVTLWLFWRSQKALIEEPTFEPRFVDLGDCRIHYLQAGQGPDLVLLHGIGASVYIWRFILPGLARTFRVTAFDLPGFGRSSKPAGIDYGLDAQCGRVLEAMGLLGIDSAHLVGSSMGGAIALWLGKLHPRRFERIAVLAPATDPALVTPFAPRLALAAPIFHRALNKQTMNLILRRILARKELITAETIDAYLLPYRDRGESLKAFWAALRLLSDHRLPQELDGLEPRILILWGEGDLMVPRKSIDKLAARVSHAQLRVHPSAGHHLQEDEPDWTLSSLGEFFLRED